MGLKAAEKILQEMVMQLRLKSKIQAEILQRKDHLEKALLYYY